MSKKTYNNKPVTKYIHNTIVLVIIVHIFSFYFTLYNANKQTNKQTIYTAFGDQQFTTPANILWLSSIYNTSQHSLVISNLQHKPTKKTHTLFCYQQFTTQKSTLFCYHQFTTQANTLLLTPIYNTSQHSFANTNLQHKQTLFC